MTSLREPTEAMRQRAKELGLQEGALFYAPKDWARDEFGRFAEVDGGALAETAIEQGGFTYEPVTGNSPEVGVAVSPYPEHSHHISGDASVEDIADEIERYVEDQGELLEDLDHHLGGWYDEVNDEIVLDVSVVRDREEAIGIMEEFGEDAVFDLGALEEIRREDVTKHAEEEPARPGGHREARGVPRARKAHQAAARTSEASLFWRGEVAKHDHWERDERGRFAETGAGGAGGGEPLNRAQVGARHAEVMGRIGGVGREVNRELAAQPNNLKLVNARQNIEGAYEWTDAALIDVREKELEGAQQKLDLADELVDAAEQDIAEVREEGTPDESPLVQLSPNADVRPNDETPRGTLSVADRGATYRETGLGNEGSAARFAQRAEQMQASLANAEILAVEELGDAQGIERVTMSDGTVMMRRPDGGTPGGGGYMTGRVATNDYAASKVAEAIGMGDNVPAVVTENTEGEHIVTYQEFMADADVMGGDARDLAALDQVIGNSDRHNGNTMRAEDGTTIGIDHGLAQFRPMNDSPFEMSLAEDRLGDNFDYEAASDNLWEAKQEAELNGAIAAAQNIETVMNNLDAIKANRDEREELRRGTEFEGVN